MITNSINHLKQSKKSYWQHFRHAFYWGCFLIYTGIISIIHGFIPSLYPFLAPKNVLKVAREASDQLQQNRS
ncbi:MAG: DUF6356 family protein [Oligoflexia bacterium]|nr:DUF6356 family protein [Oligoflexia bacterium]